MQDLHTAMRILLLSQLIPAKLREREQEWRGLQPYPEKVVELHHGNR